MKAREYPAEIERVRREIRTTKSPYRRKDLQRYLKRLQSEIRTYKQYTNTNTKENQNGRES